ncbi:MAG TPA: hypothetical protein VIV60_02095 [Polyangiaceae bacterium]
MKHAYFQQGVSGPGKTGSTKLESIAGIDGAPLEGLRPTASETRSKALEATEQNNRDAAWLSFERRRGFELHAFAKFPVAYVKSVGPPSAGAEPQIGEC